MDLRSTIDLTRIGEAVCRTYRSEPASYYGHNGWVTSERQAEGGAGALASVVPISGGFE